MADQNLQDINAAGSGQISGAASRGQSTINSFDPTAISATQLNQQGALYGPNGSQTGQMNDYMSAYKNSILNNPTAVDLYTQGNSIFNVPTLQKNATDLNNLVLQTPQNVLNTAKGFNYDNNQVNNQTTLNLEKLSPLATSATNSANTAEGLASNYVQAGLSQNATNLLPIQAYGNQLTNQLGYQATGLNTEQTNELSALVSKMQAGEQLSAAEMSAYATLSAAEESAQGTETAASTAANASQNVAKINNQNLSIAPGNTYYNPVTGYAYNPTTPIRRPS